jgi:transitional endoplasmic reticulum ATPase
MFDYLTQAQVAALFRETCRGLCIAACDADTVAADLDRMTPGDFAMVLRQARFCPVGTPQALKERLQEAVRLRPEGRASRPIGFRWDV